MTLPKDPIKAEEYRENCRLRNLGKKMSEESKLKVSLSLIGNTRNRGKCRSGEIKKKISERVIGSGNSFYGRRHTEESKHKNSIAHLNKPSPRKGVTLTEETKNKIRLSRIGKEKIARIKPIGAPTISGIKFIPLTNGLFAIVDEDDFERINTNLWVAHKSGNIVYAQRALPRKDGKQQGEKMHHAVIGRPPNGLMVDHIDGNGLNNQKKNLRLVTNRQNCMNRHQITTSKYPGVTWNKRSRKWVAHAQINGKHTHIGTFSTEDEAYEAYCKRVDPLEEKIYLPLQCPS